MSDTTPELSRLREEKKRLQKGIDDLKERGGDTSRLESEKRELERQIGLITGKETREDFPSRIAKALEGSPSGDHSEEDIDILLHLTYPNGDLILDPKSPGGMVEVIKLVREYPMDEVLEYLEGVLSPKDMIFNSPLMSNARRDLKSIQDLLTREPIAVKGTLGTCRRCGSDLLTMKEKQTRSADEAMTIFYECVSCGNAWKS